MSKFKDNEIRDLLAQAGHGLHPSSALLTSYATGELEASAKGNVERHLDGCEVCRKILEVIRSVLTEPTEEEIDAVSGTPMPDSLKTKVELISKARAKQSEIVTLIARHLVPQDMQFAIEPMFTVLFSEPLMESSGGASTLKNAAFSGGQMQSDDLNVAQAIRQAYGQYQQLLSYLATNSLKTSVDTIVRDQTLALDEEHITRLREELLGLFE